MKTVCDRIACYRLDDEIADQVVAAGLAKFATAPERPGKFKIYRPDSAEAQDLADRVKAAKPAAKPAPVVEPEPVAPAAEPAPEVAAPVDEKKPAAAPKRGPGRPAGKKGRK